MRRAALRRASRLTLIVLVLAGWTGLSPALRAQTSMTPVNGMGGYKDPATKAADAYSRGMKAKHKADGEKDPKAQRKLLEKAKDELGRSVGFSPSYDALLALGQVELALGDRSSALQSCTHALSWKPADPVAVACQNDARKKTVVEIPVAVTPGEPAVSTEPAESTEATGSAEPAEAKPPR
jgi:hypothetical protein